MKDRQKMTGKDLPTDPATTKKQGSMKHVLKKLHEGWQDQLFNLQKQRSSSRFAHGNGQFLAALSIVASTGLRPDELDKGVTLRLIENEVEVEIHGSKIAKNEAGEQERGIDIRWIRINPEYCAAAKFLSEGVRRYFLENPHKAKIDFEYNKATLARNFRELSKQFNEQFRKSKTPLNISAYVFRHNMSAHLKSCKELSKKEIAMMMGHLSTKSMQSYASAFRKKSKSPVRPILSVRTTQTPIEYASKLHQVIKPGKSKTRPVHVRRTPALSSPQLSI